MYMYCPTCEEKNDDSATACRNCGHEFRNLSSHQLGSSVYADFERRFIAHFIDGMIISVITTIIGFILTILISITPFYRAYSIELFILLFCTIGFIVPILYYADMESSVNRATFGKQAMDIVVTDLEGNRISFEKAVGRYIAKVITTLFFGIGYLTIISSEKKQGLYDIIAETVVVYN